MRMVEKTLEQILRAVLAYMCDDGVERLEPFGRFRRLSVRRRSAGMFCLFDIVR
jgi:hypothetical protein